MTKPVTQVPAFLDAARECQTVRRVEKRDGQMVSHPNRGRKLANVTGNSPFVVTTDVTGAVHYLRGTTWTSERDHASVFESVEAAQAAIGRVWQFNPKAARAARIVGGR